MFSYKVAILLTGGRQSPDGGSLQETMQALRNLNVTTYVIAIGTQSDVPVENPEDVLTVTSYNDLARQVQPIARSITKPRGTSFTSKGKFMVSRMSKTLFFEGGKSNQPVFLGTV